MHPIDHVATVPGMVATFPGSLVGASSDVCLGFGWAILIRKRSRYELFIVPLQGDFFRFEPIKSEPERRRWLPFSALGIFNFFLMPFYNLLG